MSPQQPANTFPWVPLLPGDAYKPRPPVRYAVSGIFAEGSLSIVYGPPGCLKSMLLLDCCAAVVAGRDWLEPLPGEKGAGYGTAQGAACYLDFDNGRRTLLERLEGVSRAYTLQSDDSLFCVSMPIPWLNIGAMSGPYPQHELLTNYLEGLGATFVVIDNLGTVSGDAEENSGDMIDVMSGLRRVAEDTGAAVVVIHHQRKSNGTKSRAGDTLRGHSSIEAAIDLALRVERDSDDNVLTLTATKVRGAEVDPFGAQFTYQHKPGSHELESARFFGAKPDSSNPNYQAQQTILDVLADGRKRNQSEVIANVRAKDRGLSATRVRTNLGKLVDRGIVCQEAGPMKNAQLYSLAFAP